MNKATNITAKQAQAIIDIACPRWKDSLAPKWGADIVLNQDVAVSDKFYKEMRKACTKEQHVLFDEIFGPEKHKYNVGEWIITDGYHKNYDGKALKITRIYDDNDSTYCEFEPTNGNGHNFDISMIKRLATPEEIKIATSIPKGTPCLVRDTCNGYWRLAYANGDGKFTYNEDGSGLASNWFEARIIDEIKFRN